MQPILAQAKKDIGVNVKLDYTGTLAGVQQVLNGTAARGHEAIWFSSNRYLALHPAAQARLGPSVKIMSSPVLLGLRASTAHGLGWDRARPTWSAIAAAATAGKFTYGMTSPVSSNSGFSALVGVTAALSGSGAALDAAAINRVAPRLRGFFAAQRLISGSSGWLSDTYAGAPGRVDGLINYESVLLTLNAVYVLDVSGSMRGARIASLKTALTALTGADASLAGRFQRFHDREEVTLLPFSSRPGQPVTYALPPSKPEAELARIRSYSQGLKATGSTAIYESLEKAYGVIGGEAAHDPDRITSIVLMSDGESNQGASAADFRAWYQRQPASLRQVPVFPILFGETATGEMNGLASLTHGKTFDARAQSLSAVFGEIRGYQ
jgi:uncharacterized protein YegL